MRAQPNTTIAFAAPVTITSSLSADPGSRSFPQPKPARRQHNPKPRSAPQPRPLPKPGGNR
ncbi:hypothetical protein ACQPYK_05690 [Streptosporangium sp. CA-135522]|uniref:hypothetical protein n=1 Tax=Streptosporangium sp. CA-135522 TaxID=3240072 RepID=UPI003D8FB9C4